VTERLNPGAPEGVGEAAGEAGGIDVGAVPGEIGVGDAIGGIGVGDTIGGIGVGDPTGVAGATAIMLRSSVCSNRAPSSPHQRRSPRRRGAVERALF
jgi:hypothetical protein